jgi:hypothetical protein
LSRSLKSSRGLTLLGLAGSITPIAFRLALSFIGEDTRDMPVCFDLGGFRFGQGGLGQRIGFCLLAGQFFLCQPLFFRTPRFTRRCDCFPLGTLCLHLGISRLGCTIELLEKQFLRLGCSSAALSQFFEIFQPVVILVRILSELLALATSIPLKRPGIGLAFVIYFSLRHGHPLGDHKLNADQAALN